MATGWSFPATEIVATRGDEQYRLDTAVFDGSEFPYAEDLVSPLLRYDDTSPFRIDRSVARSRLVDAGVASATAQADAMLAYAAETDRLVLSDGSVVLLHDEPPADEELLGALNTVGVLVSDLIDRLTALEPAVSEKASHLEERRAAAETDTEAAEIDTQLRELRVGLENLSDTVDGLERQLERLTTWYDFGDAGTVDHEQFREVRELVGELATTVPESTDIDGETSAERITEITETVSAVSSAVAGVASTVDPAGDTMERAEAILDELDDTEL